MAGVFINYRRDDAKSEAGRLFDWLSRYFGKGQIFMDVSGSIEPGLEFDRVIEKAVSSCDVLIVIIGKQWHAVKDENGKRRLDDPNDFVRLEIGAALKRDIRVIPVLVQGAAMPDEDNLPQDLKRLAKRQASEISDNRWEYDTEQLVKVLEKAGVKAQPGQPAVSGEQTAPNPPATKKFSWKVIAGIFIASILAIVLINQFPASEQPLSPVSDSTSPSSSYTPEPSPPATIPIPAPEPVPEPVATPRVMRSVNISGAWRGPDGMYYFQQSGNNVAFQLFAWNQVMIAQGTGMISRDTVAISYARVDNTGGEARFQISANGQQLSGIYTNFVTGETGSIVLVR